MDPFSIGGGHYLKNTDLYLAVNAFIEHRLWHGLLIYSATLNPSSIKERFERRKNCMLQGRGILIGFGAFVADEPHRPEGLRNRWKNFVT